MSTLLFPGSLRRFVSRCPDFVALERANETPRPQYPALGIVMPATQFRNIAALASLTSSRIQRRSRFLGPGFRQFQQRFVAEIYILVKLAREFGASQLQRCHLLANFLSNKSRPARPNCFAYSFDASTIGLLDSSCGKISR